MKRLLLIAALLVAAMTASAAVTITMNETIWTADRPQMIFIEVTAGAGGQAILLTPTAGTFVGVYSVGSDSADAVVKIYNDATGDTTNPTKEIGHTDWTGQPPVAIWPVYNTARFGFPVFLGVAVEGITLWVEQHVDLIILYDPN